MPSAQRATERTEELPAGLNPERSEYLDADEVARLAYSYWEERGCPEGCPEEDWYRAEHELRTRNGRHNGG